MHHGIRLALAGLLTALPLSAAVARDSIVTIELRPGVTQSFIFMEPAKPARAVVVAWPSGDGIIGLTESGMTHTVAFFPRASRRFVDAGLALVIVDVPSDKPDGLSYETRVGADHLADVAAVIAAVRARTQLPILLAGFSRATLSAAGGAASLGPDILAGVILASSVTVRAGIARYTVHDTALGEIRVPVLVLHHDNDDCILTPPDGVPDLLQALSAAPRKDSRVLSGGPGGSGGCFAHTPHDFIGAEAEAVEAVATWIETIVGPR
jgi:hypothetical protein